MEAILLNVNPKELYTIINGDKTVQIMTNKLPLNVPVYLYCLKKKPYLFFDRYLGRYIPLESNKELKLVKDKLACVGTGKVIAKCIFSDVYKTTIVDVGQKASELRKNACLSEEDFIKYCFNKKENLTDKVYNFYTISNLKIFDAPKELRDFKHWCKKTVYSGLDCPPYVDEVLTPIYKAPHIWCKIEEKE